MNERAKQGSGPRFLFKAAAIVTVIGTVIEQRFMGPDLGLSTLIGGYFPAKS
jgi:hypothetical protein